MQGMITTYNNATVEAYLTVSKFILNQHPLIEYMFVHVGPVSMKNSCWFLHTIIIMRNVKFYDNSLQSMRQNTVWWEHLIYIYIELTPFWLQGDNILLS